MSINKERAKQEALKEIGFEVQEDNIIIDEIYCEKEFIPFFNRYSDDESTWKNKEKTWKLNFDKLNILVNRRDMPRFPNLFSLRCTQNPKTHKLFKIVSEWPKNIPNIAPFPDAIEEENQLKKINEEFTALPDIDAKINFFNALKSLDKFGPISPSSAKQVMGYYVIHKTMNYTDRPVWIIQTRGIPPFRHGYANSGGYVPEDARNHMRHVIDSETGEWLFSDTIPQPIGV